MELASRIRHAPAASTRGVLRRQHKVGGGLEAAVRTCGNATTTAAEGAKARPEPGKAESNLEELRTMKAEGKCTRQQAENFVGRTRWLTGQLRARAGTATLQPFSHRASSTDGDTSWTPDLDGSLQFLEVVFDPEFLPEIVLNVNEVEVDDVPCVILLTDSMYEEVVDVWTGEKTGDLLPVGWVAVDQADGEVYTSDEVVPESFYDHFPELKQYVTRGEIVAAIGAFYSAPWLFKGRRVIHFVDNAAALSNLVNGYATKPDMARFVNLFHAALMALEHRVVRRVGPERGKRLGHHDPAGADAPAGRRAAQDLRR